MHQLTIRLGRNASLTFLLLAALVAGALALADSAAAKPPKTGDGTGGVRLHKLGNFNEPVYTAIAPGKASRKLLFVVERHGTVRVIRNGTVLDKPFIDVSDDTQVEFGGQDFNERGLLSIAFDPRYARNGRFYLYSTTKPDADVTITQYERKSGSVVRADPDSGREVISIPHPSFPNHNGGQVSFGPDGNMWIATGDGGFACDPDENASNLDSLLGKLLRISPKPNGGYTVPKGNPFVGEDGADEIYAYGLRNPFRFSFDAKTSTISIADVGQDAWEEINRQKVAKAKGANYGWDAYEGNEPLVLSDLCKTGMINNIPITGGDSPSPLPDDSVFPIHVFPHASDNPKRYTGCAVIGGPIVRDKSLKSLYGRYLYSDSCNGGLQSLIAGPRGARDDTALGKSIIGPSSITTGRGHTVYTTSLAGPVYRLDPAR
jgi:glucose/arabinose dehydrogenase